VKIAYLVNQYPQPSHSFIRREIAALEAQGLSIERFTLRASNGQLVDPRDQAEKGRARVVLDVGPIGLATATITTALTRPRAFAAALRLALRVGRRSERGLLNNLVYLAEACVLRKWLEQGKVDHVHAHFGTNSTAVAMLCRVLGGPSYSFTAHGPEEFDKVMAIRLDEKIRHAAFVVGISNFGRSQLLRWCESNAWEKIKVIRCGVDEIFLDMKDPPPPPEEARFVCVGRLVPQKGQLLLLEAVGKLAAQGVEVQVTFAGDGELRPELEKRIAELKIADRIRLGGWMTNDQVREEILQSRAMVLPSFAEGLPVVIMESLALHRPVITTRIAGIPELVSDAPPACGWVVTPGSVDELAEALRKAASARRDELAQMGAEGARRVAEAHNSRTEAARLMQLFKQVVTI
jgi:glycosyltransferase involved in cell wall biosynthesis